MVVATATWLDVNFAFQLTAHAHLITIAFDVVSWKYCYQLLHLMPVLLLSMSDFSQGLSVRSRYFSLSSLSSQSLMLMIQYHHFQNSEVLYDSAIDRASWREMLMSMYVVAAECLIAWETSCSYLILIQSKPLDFLGIVLVRAADLAIGKSTIVEAPWLNNNDVVGYFEIELWPHKSPTKQESRRSISQFPTQFQSFNGTE
jgi:hypothetical protein